MLTGRAVHRLERRALPAILPELDPGQILAADGCQHSY